MEPEIAKVEIVSKIEVETPKTAAVEKDEDLDLKREHFVQRVSSSDSDSEFSLGPRTPALQESTAPLQPAPVAEAFPTAVEVPFEVNFEAKFEEARRRSSSSSSGSSSSVSVHHRKDSTEHDDARSSSSEEADEVQKLVKNGSFYTMIL